MTNWSLAALGIYLLWGGLDPACADEKTPAGTPPAAFSLERYQGMIDRSPFAVASQTAPPPPPDTPGFAKDLILTGIVRLNGREYVTLSSRDQKQQFGLMSGETYNGITVASVAWSDAVGGTKVTLKQGSEFGIVGFDEAAARSGAAGPIPGGAAPPPGTPSLPAGVVPPNPNASSSGPSNPPPLRRRTIQTAPR